jgi:hypothetical protein
MRDMETVHDKSRKRSGAAADDGYGGSAAKAVRQCASGHRIVEWHTELNKK